MKYDIKILGMRLAQGVGMAVLSAVALRVNDWNFAHIEQDLIKAVVSGASAAFGVDLGVFAAKKRGK